VNKHVQRRDRGDRREESLRFLGVLASSAFKRRILAASSVGVVNSFRTALTTSLLTGCTTCAGRRVISAQRGRRRGHPAGCENAADAALTTEKVAPSQLATTPASSSPSSARP